MQLLKTLKLLNQTVCALLCQFYPFGINSDVTNRDYPVELKASNISGIINSPFIPHRPVKILCHGILSNYMFDFPRKIKNTYLAMPEDINVILVDWFRLTFPMVTIYKAVGNAKPIGRETRSLINAIIASGKSKMKDIHFIGHSLGAHVGAFISPISENGEKISRITGLDAAIPGFNLKTPVIDRLDPMDADFVDIIHSSPGGIIFPGRPNKPCPPGMGTADFYPNGGKNQPGCMFDMLNLCSHLLAYYYYQESITTRVGFVAYKCDSYKSYKSNCVRKNPVLMGEHVDKMIYGAYYLDTNTYSPYAEG